MVAGLMDAFQRPEPEQPFRPHATDSALHAYQHLSGSDCGFGEIPRATAEEWIKAIDDGRLQPEQAYHYTWLLIETAAHCKRSHDLESADLYRDMAYAQLTTLLSTLQHETDAAANECEEAKHGQNAATAAAAMSRYGKVALLAACAFDTSATVSIHGHRWWLDPSTNVPADGRMDRGEGLAARELQARAASILLGAYRQTESPSLLHQMHVLAAGLSINLCQRVHALPRSLLPSNLPDGQPWPSAFAALTPPRMRCGGGKNGHDLLCSADTPTGIVEVPVRLSVHPDADAANTLVIAPSIFGIGQLSPERDNVLQMLSCLIRLFGMDNNRLASAKRTLQSIEPSIIEIHRLLADVLAARPQTGVDATPATPDNIHRVGTVALGYPERATTRDMFRWRAEWDAAKKWLGNRPARNPFADKDAVESLRGCITAYEYARKEQKLLPADRLLYSWLCAQYSMLERNTKRLQRAISESWLLAQESWAADNLETYTDAMLARGWATFYRDYCSEPDTQTAGVQYRATLAELARTILWPLPRSTRSRKLTPPMRARVDNLAALLAVTYGQVPGTPDVSVLLATPHEQGSADDPDRVNMCVVGPNGAGVIGHIRNITVSMQRHAARDRGIHAIHRRDIHPDGNRFMDALRVLCDLEPPGTTANCGRAIVYDQHLRSLGQQIQSAIEYARY